MTAPAHVSFARALKGFAIAPPAPGFAYFLYAALWGGNSGEAFFLFYVGSALAYLIALIAGVPAFLTLRRLRFNGWPAYAAAGASIGLGVYFLFAPRRWIGAVLASDTARADPQFYLSLCALAGALAAIVFWAVVRPDRHEAVSAKEMA